MPQDFVHQSQAEHNEKAANFVRNTYPDWAVTMCFYAAIHWVERYARIQGVDLDAKYYTTKNPHERRFAYVKDVAVNLREAELRIAYQDLQKYSQVARYLENIRTNSFDYFTRQESGKVSLAFENLEIIKRLLGISRTAK